jgi:hypothetical protein
MGIYDSSLGIVKNQLAGGGSPSLRTLDDILRQQKLAANPVARGLPDIRTTARSGQASGPGGWQGFLASIMGSVPGKVLLKAGEVISMPGRAVTSIVKEFADALDSDPNTVASWNDFGRQIMDPSFGFGSVTGDLTGMKWVDRLIGFAGDVILDPLTYMTLGASRAARVVDASGNVVRGSKTLSIATADGRMALANKIRELGASDELTKAVARKGRAALRGPSGLDLLEKAGYDRAGLYWFGKRIKGTERIGEALESGLSGLRVWSGDHIFNKVGALFTPGDMLDLRKAIARGQAPAADVGAFMDMILSRNVERADAVAGVRQAKSIRQDFMGNLDEADLSAARGTVYRYLDVGGPPIDMATPDGRVATQVKAMLEKMYKNVEGAARAIDSRAPIGKIPDSYFPHMATDRAFRWMRNGNNPGSVKARGQVFNPFDNTGSWKARMVAGDEVGSYVLTQADIDGGIDSLNKIFRREYELDFDFFETDLVRVLDRYDEMYGGMLGKIGRKKFLTERGTYDIIKERLEPIPEIQEMLQKQLKANIKARTAKQKLASKKLTDLTGTIDNMLGVRSRSLQAQIGEAGQRIAATTLLEGQLSYSKAKVIREIRSAADELRAAAGSLKVMQDLNERSPFVAFLDAQQDGIIAQLDTLADDIEYNDLMETLGPEGINQRAAEINLKIQEFAKKEEDILKKSNVLGEHFEAILSGTDIEGNVNFTKSIRRSFASGTKVADQQRLSGDKLITGKAKGKNQSFAVIDGVEYKGVRSRDWWKRVNRYNPVKTTQLAKRATKPEFRKAIQRTIRTDVGIDEMRNLGMTVAAIIDTLPEGSLSDAAKNNFEKLVKALEDADKSSQYYKQLSMARRNRRSEIVIGQVKNNYDYIERSVQTNLNTYFAAASMLQEVFSEIDLIAMADEFVPGETIYRLLQDEKYENLGFILGRYADGSGSWSDPVRSFRELNDLSFDPAQRRVINDPDFSSTADRLTYSELENILTRAVDASKNATYDMKLETNTIIDGVLPVRPKGAPTEIRIADLIDELYQWADEKGISGVPFPEDIDNFVLQRFWLQYKPWVETIEEYQRRGGTALFDAAGAREVNKEIRQIRAGEAPATGAEKTVKSKSIARLQELGELQVRLAQSNNPAETRFLQERVAELEMAEYGDVPKRGQTLNKTGRSDARGMRGLESQKKATERFLAVVDDSLRPSDVLSIEEAEKNLKQIVLKTFFETEIETRFNSLTSLMASEGLVPDEDLFRLVVNSVAKEFADSSRQIINEGRYAAARINEIIEMVGGNLDRKKELKAIIANPPKTAVGDADMAAVFAAEDELARLNKAPKLNAEQKARKKQLIEIINNPPKGDAQNNFAAVLAAEKELSQMNDPSYWVGREHELYKLIVGMLRDDSPAGATSWATRVTEANGRHDVQSLLAEMKMLGGTKGQGGIPNQRKKLVQMLKRAESPEVAASIQAQLDALPSEEALKKMREDFYNKKAIPWFRRAVDNSKNPSRADIESSLIAVAPYATSGGKLSPDATVDQMLEWLNVTAMNLKNSNDEVRRSFAWTLEAADPFLDVTRFMAGEEQNLPSIFVNSLLYTAKQVDAQSINVENARKLATQTAEAAETAESKAKNAERLLKSMEQPRGQFAGLVDETETDYFKETRKALIRLTEMKNNINTPGKPLYVAAVERREVNDLIQALAPYVYSQNTPLVYMKDVPEMAAERFVKGQVVYRRKRVGNPSEVREMQIIRRELDDLNTQISQVTSTLDVEFAEGSSRKVVYKKNQFDQLGKLKKLYNEKLDRYKALNRRNPDNLDTYVKINDLSEIEDGYMYFFPSPDSIYATAPERLDEIMEEVKRLRQGRKHEEAFKLLREVQDTMLPVRASSNRALLIDGEALTFGPDDINGLFARGMEGEEFILNYDDPNAVRAVVESGRSSEFLQAVALQKISAISRAIKTGKITKKQFLNALEHTAQFNQGTVFFANDVVRTTRNELIDRAWNSSPEKAWLDEVAAFEQSINLGKWNAKITNANRSINTAYNLRQKANEARGLFGDKTAPFGMEVDTVKYGQAIGKGMSPAEARKFALGPAKRPVKGLAGEEFKFDELYSGLENQLKKLDGLLKKEKYSATTRFKELVAGGARYNEAMVTIGEEVARLRPLDQRFVDVTASLQSVIDEGDKLSKELAFLKENSLKFERTTELNAELQRIRKIRKDMISDQLRKTLIPQRLEDVSRRLVELNHDLSELSLKFDQTKLLRLNAVDHHNSVVPRLKLQVEVIEKARERLNSIAKGDGTLMEKNAELELWLEESKELLEEVGSTIIPGKRVSEVPPDDLLERAQWMMERMKDTPDQRVYSKDYEKYLMLKSEYLSAVQDFILRDNSYNEAMRVMENLNDFDWAVDAKRLADEGMVALDKIGLPSYQATPEILELSRNMQQFIEPEFVRGLNKFIGGYTGFFKAYATSTPGFVVRNTMTNTFMLAAGGASPKNMTEGLKLYRAWRKAVSANTEAEFIETLAKQGGDAKEILEMTIRAADASGYGRSHESMAGWNPKRMTLKDNRYTRFHKKWNEASEGSARFIMAYDSVVRGDDFNTAVARVKKYFFDYEDIGAADEVLRSIIPFWFWMSRNLPLQLTNKWANPKAYLMYDKIMKNIRSDKEEDRYLPSWMATIGATRIGGDTYLTPDLGFNRIEEDVTRLASPLSAGFLDMVNPGLRVPLELMTNRRFRYGNEFREEGQQAAGGPLSPAVQALAGLLGPFSQERQMSNGQAGVTDKFNYAAQALLPFLGQSERILPGTERGKQNQTNSWLSYLGVPIRTVTPQDRQNERKRQIYEKEELRRRAERGY